MGETDIILWLQRWYENVCVDDREHTYGVEITTIDNPGWSVTIPLKNSSFAKIPNQKKEINVSDTDWFVCRIKDQEFQGQGDPKKLGVILRTFQEWVEQA